MPENVPVLLALASAPSVVSTYTSTVSNAPNPVPDTVTVDPGGPLAGEVTIPRVTLNFAVLDVVPWGWSPRTARSRRSEALSR
jgi:hypothetical protein